MSKHKQPIIIIRKRKSMAMTIMAARGKSPTPTL